MDIGIKIYPKDIAYARRIAKYCDFFEVTAIPDSDFRALKSIKKPFTIHTIHSKWGFNAANPEKAGTINRKGIETAKKAADVLGSDTIVIHPGHIENSECSIKHTIALIKPLDSRFVVENMPAQTRGVPHVGSSISDMRDILRNTKKRMCLDFPHAAESAYQSNLPYVDFVKGLMGLKPRYFHISDTRIQTKRDMHLHLKEGDLKLWYFTRIVPEQSRILIETAHDFRKQHSDIEILRKR